MKTIEELKALIQAGEEAKRELEERGRVKFREGEIVVGKASCAPAKWSAFLSENYRKLTLEELVLSMAPPEAVRWGMTDSDCVMFYDKDDVSFDCIVLSQNMARDDWESVGGEL